MERVYLIAALILYSLGASTQTMDLEERYLNEQFDAKAITFDVVRERNKELKSLQEKGIYPEVFFDTLILEPSIRYINIFPGLKKAEIFERTLQWCSLMANDRDAITKYQNQETGKIIWKGFCRIPYKTSYSGIFSFLKTTTVTNCWVTIMVTVVDGAAKTEFMSMRYVFREPTYNSATIAFEEVYMADLYPIAQHDTGKIKNIVSMLNSTIARLGMFNLSMSKYVESNNADYKF